MKKFEVPYNFNDDYFDKLIECKEYFDYIKFIYMPAYDEDYIQNTREETLIYNMNYKIWNNYVNIIKRFQSLNLDICILIQRNASLKLIEKYINEFNIKYFVINDDKLAKIIKRKYGDNIYLSLSITSKLKFNDIIYNNYSMYDEIVLDFWFNRHLQYIKKLPTKYKYAILTNSTCAYNCTYVKYHWFNTNKKLFYENKKYYFDKCPSNLNNNIKICSNDLIYFNNYITSFKLIDRTYSSIDIKEVIEEYISSYINIKNIKFDIEREKHFCLED